MGEVLNDRMLRCLDWEASVQSDSGRALFLAECSTARHLKDVCKRLDLPLARVTAFLAQHAELDRMAKEALRWYAHQLAAEAKEIADAAPVAVMTPDGELARDEDGEVILGWPDVKRDTLRVNTNFRLAAFYNEKYRPEVEQGAVTNVQINIGVRGAPKVIEDDAGV